MAKRDLPVLQPPSDIEIHDNTMLDWHARCPFLYWIRAVRGLSPRIVAQPLSFGSLLHDGLAEYYIALNEGDDWMTAGERAIRVIQAMEYDDPVDGHRTKQRAALVMVEYIEEYKEDSDFREILFTETPFRITDDNGFGYGGRIDLIVKAYGGQIWEVDHKTSSWFGSTYFEQFKSAPQFCGYTWAGTQLHGKPLAGVIVNNITIRKTGKTEFHREPLRYPEWMVEEWYEDTIRRLHNIKRDIDDEYFERRRYNCRNKYGKCDAWSVCHGLPENTEKLLASYFVDHKWNWEDPTGRV